MQLVKIKGTRFGVYRRADGRLIVKYQDETGPRQRTFTKAAEANSFCREAYRNWGGRTDRAPFSVTEMIDEHMAERERLFEKRLPYPHGIAENTIIRDRAAADRIRERWGSESAWGLDRTAASRWFKSMLDEGLSESTVAGYAGVLRKAVRYAMREDGPLRDLDANPVGSVSVITRRPGRRFTAEQTWAILDGIHPAYRAFAYTLAFSGMRIEEICRLDVEDFDSKALELRGGIKTEAGIDRVVAIDEKLALVIADHLGDRTKGPLFLNTRGNRINADSWRARQWKPVVESLGLAGAQPHWNRHTAASIAAENGADLWNLMLHFGWKDTRQAARYVHLARKGVRSIADSSMPPAPLRKVQGR